MANSGCHHEKISYQEYNLQCTDCGSTWERDGEGINHFSKVN